MRAPFEWRAPPWDMLRGIQAANLGGVTRLAFVERFHAELVRIRGDRQVVARPLARNGQDHRPAFEVRDASLEARDVVDSLGRTSDDAVLVLAIASPVRLASERDLGASLTAVVEAETRAWLAALLGRPLATPRAVLVLDLADGESAGPVLARVLRALLDDEVPVACWNPQRDVR